MSKKRCAIMFILLIVLMVVACLLGISIGSVKVDLSTFLDSIINGINDKNITSNRIVLNIRLPRVLAALVLGGALSVSGYLLQTFFANPIAGPFILGISSGAKLVVALLMVVMLNTGTVISSGMMILAAFVGSFMAMGFILAISRHVEKMSVLIICGVMIGYICSAITDFVVTFADDSNIVNLHNWSLGSFSGINMSNVVVMSVVVLITLVITFAMSKQIKTFLIGESYAKNAGVNIRVFKFLLVILSSILSSCVTAFAGPISFVGVAVPQLVKRIFETSSPFVVIPACFIAGADFCMICDLIARTVFAPTELSISTITAVFGAPVVIYVMIKRQKGRVR